MARGRMVTTWSSLDGGCKILINHVFIICRKIVEGGSNHYYYLPNDSYVYEGRGDQLLLVSNDETMVHYFLNNEPVVH